MSLPKGSTRNRLTSGQVLIYARQIMHTHKLSWQAALTRAKAILAI